MIVLPRQQARILQPGDCRAHPRVVGGGIPLERAFALLAQDFAGGGDHLAVHLLIAVPAVQIAQGLQDALDFVPSEPETRRQPELALYVVRRVQQHATGRLLVAAGTAGLLQVVLQGSGNVGVNHQAHVRLVNAHAKGVCRDDHPQFSVDEALLGILFDLG